MRVRIEGGEAGGGLEEAYCESGGGPAAEEVEALQQGNPWNVKEMVLRLHWREASKH